VRSLFLLRIRPWGLLEAAGILAVIGTAGSVLGSITWWLDLLTHFPVQYAVVLLLLALGYWVRRKTRLAWGAFALSAMNGTLVVPLYLGGETCHTPGLSVSRAVLANVSGRLGDPDAVTRLARATHPDVLVLLEVNERWLRHLDSLSDFLPYRVAQPRDDEFGIALYSRHRFHSTEILAIGLAGVPTVVADVDLAGHRLRLIGTHPVPPGGAVLSDYRNDQLRKLGEFLRGYEGPLLLLGDLNVTPWSSHFRRFVQGAGLRNASQGRGPQPTWPALPWPLSIPLDHALHSPEVCIVGKRIGTAVRSDHYPVIVDFQLRGG
jgi:endonuclease/exonuclease/phosphatase (EEP) superfamily protein YafD